MLHLYFHLKEKLKCLSNVTTEKMSSNVKQVQWCCKQRCFHAVGHTGLKPSIKYLYCTWHTTYFNVFMFLLLSAELKACRIVRSSTLPAAFKVSKQVVRHTNYKNMRHSGTETAILNRASDSMHEIKKKSYIKLHRLHDQTLVHDWVVINMYEQVCMNKWS